MTDPTRFFLGWRAQSLVGSRDVLDGVVRPEHRAPSPELAQFLAQWPGAWYWGDDQHTRLVLIQGSATPRPERWLWHGGLLLLTILCTLAAGAVIAHVWSPVIRPGWGGAVVGVVEFAEFVLAGGWRELLPGWRFAVPLLLILLVHELGHYLAARRYAIDVSPPYFLPVPPNLSPIGNLGAFIRIRSPVYDRRQLLDVGAAGPLAGFVVAIAVLLWGYQDSLRLTLPIAGEPSLIQIVGAPIVLGDSLLTHALRDWLLPGSGSVLLSPTAFAGWVGMFITGLNLLPLSQLDGGHVLYGLWGKRQVQISWLVVLGLLVLGRSAAVWWLWVALTFAIGGGRWSHPSVILPERPVLRNGRITGWACIVVFILTFVPIPFAR
ncbi:MAG: site-2 protease family protein [Gemmatimonadales bacterium]|nr:site-2 protease family protein [Gemmatimonadales bacterium]MDZ4389188.1 site-2 protease family protein [Gemmatimonadales bacterium]